MQQLKDLPMLNTLDIRKNNLQDPKLLDDVFALMPELGVLYTKDNSFRVEIKTYRKVMIAKIKKLDYLDERPVEDKERRLAEAFLAGAKEAEQKEREAYDKEQEVKEQTRQE